ncbi:MAG: glycosyltransferase [Phycisphaerae bacterium]|nr:glycosyltransferase [Phycisphaerae bacterium]
MSMCVLHVVESLEPEAGSIAIALAGLFAVLEKHGIKSQAVTLDSSGEGVCDVDHTTFAPRMAAQLVGEADVVHVHGWGTELARSAARAAQKAGKPYVISPLGALAHGRYNKKGWRGKLRGLLSENKLLRQAVAITALNTLEQQTLQADGINACVCVLPYGLSFGDYEVKADDVGLPAGLPGRCLLILGPIHPIEGLVPLMTAFAELGKDAEGWNLVLAGREVGDWRKMLEAAVRRKGGAGRVLFTTAPDVATQRAWLGRASALAAPSLHIRCPVSVMQAVAAGVPVLATEPTAPDGLDGVIQACTPSRAGLGEALRFICRLDEHERATSAQKAREAGRLRFDWSVLAERYVQLYEGSVGSR